MENHHFIWENPLFQWQFSIAMLNYMLNYQRVTLVCEILETVQAWRWEDLQDLGISGGWSRPLRTSFNKGSDHHVVPSRIEEIAIENSGCSDFTSSD